jgi:hypothetical protein
VFAKICGKYSVAHVWTTCFTSKATGLSLYTCRDLLRVFVQCSVRGRAWIPSDVVDDVVRPQRRPCRLLITVHRGRTVLIFLGLGRAWASYFALRLFPVWEIY